MKELKLDLDEGIIVQTIDVERYKKNDEYIEVYELYLTNKNLICIYEKSNGVFKKTETIVEKIPLSDIKVVSGKVQVSKVNNDDYGLGMQILFVNGSREHFVFTNNKKELQNWIDLIVETITGEKPIIVEKDKNVGKTTSSLIAGFKKVVDSTKDVVSDIKNQVIDEFYNDNEKNIIDLEQEKKKEQGLEETNKKNDKRKIIMENEKEKYIYCSSCGEKLSAKSKFCNICGEATTNTQEPVEETKVENEDVKIEEQTERKKVYDGKIHKCPNCGETLKAFDIKCPSCGFEIRDRNASNSLREFSLKLEKIESTREKKKATSIFAQTLTGDNLSKTDEQKISLIRSFIIPNTKEDLYEFLILSKSNIEIDLYENTQLKTARLAVSDAWKAKFEQAYQKAKLLFKNDDRMIEIQAMYDEVNKSIEKAKWKTWKLVGIIYGVIFAFLIFIFTIVALTGGFSSENNENNNGGNTPITEENNNSNEQDDNEQNNISENETSNSGSFNEKKAIKNLKIKEYKMESYLNNGLILVIENNNDFDIHLDGSIEFYDKNKELIGVSDSSIEILEKNTTSIMSFWNDDKFDSFKYEFTVKENEYYKAGISNITYTNKRVKDKEIVSVTNKGKDKIAFVEGNVLFFKNDKLIEIDSTYIDNNGYYLDPGKTVTKEFECYECNYDSVQIYFTGRVEK